MTIKRLNPTKLWGVITPNGTLYAAAANKKFAKSMMNVYWRPGKNGEPEETGRDRMARVLVIEVTK